MFIAKTSKDSQNLGWLDYDRAFRKKAVGSPSISWSSVDTPLYLATVVGWAENNKSIMVSNGGHGKFSSSSPFNQKLICFKYNDGLCSVQDCKFQHVCLKCKESHRVLDCPRPTFGRADRGTRRAGRDRSASPSSPIKKKKK